MPDPIHIRSLSNAGDLGFLALADLAAAAEGVDYRVVGGHMVHLLTHIYPTSGAVPRVTSDADAGIDRPTAAGQDIHLALLARGYTAQSGNHYTKAISDQEELAVDLLVPRSTSDATVQIAGRGFDPIPGLGFALSCPAVHIAIDAHLQDGRTLNFIVPIPDVEPALILKILAWQKRKADKDVSDIASLLEIAHEHRGAVEQWSHPGGSMTLRGL